MPEVDSTPPTPGADNFSSELDSRHPPAKAQVGRQQISSSLDPSHTCGFHSGSAFTKGNFALAECAWLMQEVARVYKHGASLWSCHQHKQSCQLAVMSFHFFRRSRRLASTAMITSFCSIQTLYQLGQWQINFWLNLPKASWPTHQESGRRLESDWKRLVRPGAQLMGGRWLTFTIMSSRLVNSCGCTAKIGMLSRLMLIRSSWRWSHSCKGCVGSILWQLKHYNKGSLMILRGTFAKRPKSITAVCVLSETSLRRLMWIESPLFAWEGPAVHWYVGLGRTQLYPFGLYEVSQLQGSTKLARISRIDRKVKEFPSLFLYFNEQQLPS